MTKSTDGSFIKLLKLVDPIDLVLLVSTFWWARFFFHPEDELNKLPIYRAYLETLPHDVWQICFSVLCLLFFLSSLTRHMEFKRIAAQAGIAGWGFTGIALAFSSIPNVLGGQALIFAVGSFWMYWRAGLNKETHEVEIPDYLRPAS